MDLGGKTLIVTGASRGIGRALASELAQNRVNLVMNARNEALLEEVATAARGKGVHALTVVGDAALASNAREMVKAAVGIGEFVGFIHNAGTLHPGRLFDQLPEAMFEDVWRSDVLAAYQIARFSYPELRQRKGGLVVFFGSGAAEMNVEGIGAYCLSKAAEEHLLDRSPAQGLQKSLVSCIDLGLSTLRCRSVPAKQEAAGLRCYTESSES